MSDSLDHQALDSQLEGLCEAPRWWVGFSGGVDSTVLLHLLHAWCRANPGAPELRALYVHHGIQAQAEDWRVHCEQVCNFLHVPFDSRRVSTEAGGRGLEAAAREARYRVFDEVLGEGEVLFLAHHLDDQVETFFLRLLRGAGVQGLAAMPASRPLAAGSLVRPLLDVSRRELEAYAASHDLHCIEDPSNADTALDRNYLRREVLPLLESRWPGYRRTVGRAAGHVAAAAGQLAAGVDLPVTLVSRCGDPGIDEAPLRAASPDQAALQLRGWLRSGGYQAPDESRLQEFLRQLREAGSEASPRLQCRDYGLQRYRGAVYVVPARGDQPVATGISPGETLELTGVGNVSLLPASGAGLALGADTSLQLRFREGGERCRPVDRDAGNSLKKLLQEARVPQWWRDRVPLLYLDDELLAVGALGPCQSSRWRVNAEAGESLWQLHWQPPVAGGFR